MKDNKSAFPCHASEGWNESGMTLRDYFAGQALCGSAHYPIYSYEDHAKRAYDIADAMLKAREKI